MQKFSLQSFIRKGQKVVLLHSGVTEFNAEGVAEVELRDETELQEMLHSYPDLAVKATEGGADPLEIKPQTEENDLGKASDEDNDLGSSEEGDIKGAVIAPEAAPDQTEPTVEPLPTVTEPATGTDGGVDLIAQLEGMKVAELKTLASDSGFAEAEWNELKKPELKAYLIGKLQLA